jgi:hypothetical protein
LYYHWQEEAEQLLQEQADEVDVEEVAIKQIRRALLIDSGTPSTTSMCVVRSAAVFVFGMMLVLLW